MSAAAKIVAGALATAAFAWLLHGPLGLGAPCASAGAAFTMTLILALVLFAAGLAVGGVIWGGQPRRR